MADKGYRTLNDKASRFNPMRGFIWTIDFDNDVDSKVTKELFSDGYHVDMMSQKISLPSKTLQFIKVNVMGSERMHPAKFSFEHDFSIDFLEDEEANIQTRFERWLLACHPMQHNIKDGTGQSFMALGDKFDSEGNYDLATNFVVTLYKYGSADGIQGDPIMRYRINGAMPESVSEPELNRTDTESVVLTKVGFKCDYVTKIFNNMDEKQTELILGK